MVLWPETDDDFDLFSLASPNKTISLSPAAMSSAGRSEVIQDSSQLKLNEHVERKMQEFELQLKRRYLLQSIKDN